MCELGSLKKGIEKMNIIARSSALAALATIASAAHGYQFAVLSDGTFTNANTTSVETVVSQINTPTNLVTLTLVVNVAAMTGTGEYTSAGGNLDFTFTYPNVNMINDGQYIAATWTWSNTSTGAYANVSGGGTFGSGINAFNAQTGTWHSNTALVGNLTPVPEPTAFAALDVGAIALVRRRSR